MEKFDYKEIIRGAFRAIEFVSFLECLDKNKIKLLMEFFDIKPEKLIDVKVALANLKSKENQKILMKNLGIEEGKK